MNAVKSAYEVIRLHEENLALKSEVAELRAYKKAREKQDNEYLKDSLRQFDSFLNSAKVSAPVIGEIWADCADGNETKIQNVFARGNKVIVVLDGDDEWPLNSFLDQFYKVSK